MIGAGALTLAWALVVWQWQDPFTALGYVGTAAVVVTLAWAAAAAQLVALVAGRYAPYPAAGERPPRGPLRELVRKIVLARRARRRAPAVVRLTFGVR